jgi:DUF4097 and DUF4098 domain-containing protein YvlB
VITSINSNLSFENVGGPIVANNTNGNVEIVFENIAPNKPNSISEVNGFVDTTLDSKVGADVKLNTINGGVCLKRIKSGKLFHMTHLFINL